MSKKKKSKKSEPVESAEPKAKIFDLAKNSLDELHKLEMSSMDDRLTDEELESLLNDTTELDLTEKVKMDDEEEFEETKEIEEDENDAESDETMEIKTEEAAEAEAVREPETDQMTAAEADDGADSENSTDIDTGADDREYLEPERVESIIESLLFTSEKPVGISTIKQAFKGAFVKKEHIVSALDRLAIEYASGKRGVTLEQVSGGYQLRTKLDNTRYLRNMGKTKTFRLTGPSLETLAIIAYKEPITKAEVDQIRGVESGHLVRALMEKGLVTFAGKSEGPGKPMQYATTKKFLEIFGLRNLKELPSLSEIDELLPEGIDEEAGEKMTIDQVSEKMGETIVASYSEGEEELMAIAGELEQISTSSDFFEQEKQREREKRDRERAQDIREAIVLGNPVDDKDRKWLQKYEAAIEAKANASAEPVSTNDNSQAQTDDERLLQDLTAAETPAEPSNDPEVPAT